MAGQEAWVVTCLVKVEILGLRQYIEQVSATPCFDFM